MAGLSGTDIAGGTDACDGSDGINTYGGVVVLRPEDPAGIR